MQVHPGVGLKALPSDARPREKLLARGAFRRFGLIRWHSHYPNFGLALSRLQLRGEALHFPLQCRDLGTMAGDRLAHALKFRLELLARHANNFGAKGIRKCIHMPDGNFDHLTRT